MKKPTLTNDNPTVASNPFDIEVKSEDHSFDYSIEAITDDKDLKVLRLKISYDQVQTPAPIVIQWKFPSINVKGVWKSSIDNTKRLQYDWELESLFSRISVDAPAISVYGHNDQNICTFASSESINLIEMNARLREEDNHVYCFVKLFSEPSPAISSYEVDFVIDFRELLFSESLIHVANWWTSSDSMKPCHVPDISLEPLYSTWYNYHQNLEIDKILEECRLAKSLGCESIILDDGWQTLDSNRGYDFTGDWLPERIPDMKSFVADIHKLGMKVGLWFSVPFAGLKSEAYAKFKDKVLTKNHRWSPILDPRYPEVRQHLIGAYVSAVRDYDLDGLKLDFIDEFKAYPETELTKENGRDFVSINEAVDAFFCELIVELHRIKPDIFIEFRQQYIGPALRKFGNMFRAFDCPNDSNTNRVRIADVRLLMGDSPVHSDPLTWHFDEDVHLVALQLLNALFAVPQLSVELHSLPSDHLQMLRFYTDYWLANRDILMKGSFVPQKPSAGYPIITASDGNKKIIGVYDSLVVDIDSNHQTIDLLNAKTCDNLIIRSKSNNFSYNLTIFDCTGNCVNEATFDFKNPLSEIKVPVSGLLRLTKT